MIKIKSVTEITDIFTILCKMWMKTSALKKTVYLKCMIQGIASILKTRPPACLPTLSSTHKQSCSHPAHSNHCVWGSPGSHTLALQRGEGWGCLQSIKETSVVLGGIPTVEHQPLGIRLASEKPLTLNTGQPHLVIQDLLYSFFLRQTAKSPVVPQPRETSCQHFGVSHLKTFFPVSI